jgi:hypothetical protein
MRATGWRATAIRFQQFDEALCRTLSPEFAAGAVADLYPLVRGVDDSDRRWGWHPRRWRVGSAPPPAIFLFSFLPGDVELPGHRGRRPASTQSPIPTDVYASAIGLFKDSIIMQSRKPSNSDFCRSFNM